MDRIKIIAYYLPQFHELDINVPMYGKGYSEWTKAASAKPLFKGHYQPHLPADLGFYNLLMPEAREAQAEMARSYGIDGFCYWHYWFGNGITTMEKPLAEVLRLGKPDFPICLCWANHTWRNPETKELIQEQLYPGDDDYIAHFNYVKSAFEDKRYICVDNKPLFGIFAPELVPDLNHFMELWNNLAKDIGLTGIYFVGITQTPQAYEIVKQTNIDAINTVRLKDYFWHQNKYWDYIKNLLHIRKSVNKYNYTDFLQYFISQEDIDERNIPTIIPGWDHSPRYGKEGLILDNYTPQFFEQHVQTALNIVSKKENKLCFVKAWNEWGEGNYLEPDLKYGRQFLEVLKETKEKYSK